MVFRGLWKENLKEGKGKEQHKDGAIFDGSYKNGKKFGNGVFTDAAGNTYTGNYFEDMRTGTHAVKFKATGQTEKWVYENGVFVRKA